MNGMNIVDSKRVLIFLFGLMLLFLGINPWAQAAGSWDKESKSGLFTQSTNIHKKEIVTAGLFIIKKFPQLVNLFSSQGIEVKPMKPNELIEGLKLYLQLHDDPKLWDRTKLEAYGYNNLLEIPEIFFNNHYGEQFTSGSEVGKTGRAVILAMNQVESQYKKDFFNSKEGSKYKSVKEMFEFIEQIADVFCTKMSIRRQRELDMQLYQFPQGTVWLVGLNLPDDQLSQRDNFYLNNSKLLMRIEKILFEQRTFWQHQDDSSQKLSHSDESVVNKKSRKKKDPQDFQREKNMVQKILLAASGFFHSSKLNSPISCREIISQVPAQ